MTLKELVTSLSERTKALKNELKQNGDKILDFDLTLTTKDQVPPFGIDDVQTNVKLGFVEINTPNGLPNIMGLILPMKPNVPPVGGVKTVECPHCHNTITV